MADDWRDEIFKLFPGFFERGADITCPEAWKKIVIQAISWIRHLAPEVTCSYIEDEDGLRFCLSYNDPIDEEILSKFLDEIRHISQETCERCGKLGELRGVKPNQIHIGISLCDDCWKAFND